MAFNTDKAGTREGRNEEDAVISVSGLSKRFILYSNPLDRFRRMARLTLPRMADRIKNNANEFWALQDVSFSLKKGGVLGVIGENGAGKSTLLQILAGISAPTEGRVSVNGSVGALLELGSGFHPEFTGRENVFLAGAVLGFSRKTIFKHLEEISDFAEIGDFFDQPVRTYSSGMFLRLAFSLNACLAPDVLLVDEVLAVGDVYFQQKCHTRISEMIGRGTSVVLVSHFMKTVEKYADSVLVLDKGKNVFLGNPIEAMDHYNQIASRGDRNAPGGAISDVPKSDNFAGEWSVAIKEWPVLAPPDSDRQDAVAGSKAVCLGYLLTDGHGRKKTTFAVGEIACFHYEFGLENGMENPAGGIRITNEANIHIHARSSRQHGVPAPSYAEKGSRLRFRQKMKLEIAPGTYTYSIYLGEFDSGGRGDTDPKSLCVVTKAGFIEVVPPKGPDSVSFYDMVNLEGECSLQVIGPDGD